MTYSRNNTCVRESSQEATSGDFLLAQIQEKPGIGDRLAQARRVLGAAMHQDMTRKAAAALIGVTGPTWTRWENGDDKPSDENLIRFVRICAQYGLPGITLGWINYGEGSGPPRVGSHRPEKPAPATPLVSKRKPAPRGGETQKRKRG